MARRSDPAAPATPAVSVVSVVDGHAAAVADALRRSDGARWGVTTARLATAIETAVQQRFGDRTDDASHGAVHTFIAALHADDLALACACADGHAAAWDHFVLTHRPELYRAARAIAGESGRELADSLYAELYGLSDADGGRRSLFRYFHGRSRLGTWLRSVLAQRHVDGLRGQRRLTSLDDPEHPVAEPPAAATVDPDVSARMRVAAQCISEALSQLDAALRLRLAYYYVHGLTLAHTGRLFGEHEATASRKLDKARSALRAGIEAAMQARGERIADVESWTAVAREAWDAALADALGVAAPDGLVTQDSGDGAFKGKRTS